jgi:hypothetical protein
MPRVGAHEGATYADRGHSHLNLGGVTQTSVPPQRSNLSECSARMQGRGPNIPSGALLLRLLVEDPPLVEMEDLPPLLVDDFLQQVLEEWQHMELTSRSPPSLLTICRSASAPTAL